MRPTHQVGRGPVLPILGQHVRNTDAVGQVTDTARLTPFWVPVGCTVTGVRLVIRTSSGNLDVGIYDNSGNRLVSTGEVASPGAGDAELIDLTDIYLSPGIYWLAVAADNNTVAYGGEGAHAFRASKTFVTSSPLPVTLDLDTPSAIDDIIIGHAIVISEGVTVGNTT